MHLKSLKKNITHHYTGASLLELYEKYGTGKAGFAGFLSSKPWWVNESFATEKPEAGEYEIMIGNDLIDKTYDEQLEEIPQEFEVTHPAILAEAILAYYEETKKRLCEGYYLRTSSLDSVGFRVFVGNFGTRGLGVSDCWGAHLNGLFGLSAARKLEMLKPSSLEPFDYSSLEHRVKALEDTLLKIKETIKI